MADYRAEVGLRLRKMRVARDLSQEDAAHELGVTAKTLSRWENGRRWPLAQHWTKVKDFYGADPREGVESPGPLGLSQNGSQPPDDLADIKAQLDRIEKQLGKLLDGDWLRELWRASGAIDPEEPQSPPDEDRREESA